MRNNAIQLVANSINLALQDNESSQWIIQLADRINSLLVGDFDKLISILYRMDVSELKLRQLLEDNPTEDAGKLIAELMVERQAEKIRTRQQFSQEDHDIDEKEKW